MYAFLLLPLLLIGDPTPKELNLDTASLSDGPFSEMEMVYQKSFLFSSVDVLQLKIRFGPRATGKFRSLLEDRDEVSSTVERKIVSTALSAENVLVEIRFLRDIGLDRFIQEARRKASGTLVQAPRLGLQAERLPSIIERMAGAVDAPSSLLKFSVSGRPPASGHAQPRSLQHINAVDLSDPIVLTHLSLHSRSEKRVQGVLGS